MSFVSRFLKHSSAEQNLRSFLMRILKSSSPENDTHDLDKHEKALILNVLAQKERTADDVMIPRADIVALPADISIAEALDRMGIEHHSRMPVYRGELDDVIGMIHVKDLVGYDKKEGEQNLSDYLRDPLFIAPNISVLDLLLLMRQRRTHMALVIDEHGSVDGLVTIEDLIETIVGDISDEHDELEPPHWQERKDGTVELDARMKLADFEKKIGPALTEEERDADIDTIGGLIFKLAERVPKRHEQVTHSSGLKFHVLNSDSRHIQTLKMEVPKNWDASLGRIVPQEETEVTQN